MQNRSDLLGVNVTPTIGVHIVASVSLQVWSELYSSVFTVRRVTRRSDGPGICRIQRYRLISVHHQAFQVLVTVKTLPRWIIPMITRMKVLEMTYVALVGKGLMLCASQPPTVSSLNSE